MHFAPLGDRALTITLGTTIDESTHRLVRAVSACIDQRTPLGVTDQVPAFASLTVHYDPARVEPGADPTASPYQRLVCALERQLASVQPDVPPSPRVVEVPVCYGGAFGPDLHSVAGQHGIATDDVVRLHSSADYLVHMVGFMPGFAYLGGLPDAIATSRRAEPRTVVPAGTVGIGGLQTGIYPLDSPGGWNLIGRTPLTVFDATRDTPALLAIGDRVRFRPISTTEFQEWSAPS